MTDEEYVDADSELGFAPAVVDDARAVRALPAAPRRRGSLRRRAASVAVLIGALTTVGGGYALLAPSSGADDTASSSADIEHGRQLYNTSCITCHGANLQGVKDRGPTLIGVGSAAAYFQVSTGRMPAPAQGALELRKTPKFTEAQTVAVQRLAGFAPPLSVSWDQWAKGFTVSLRALTALRRR